MTPGSRILTAIALSSFLRVAPAIAPAVIPIQAETITVLDLVRMHVGSSVLLRVLAPWTGSGCTLKTGSILEGRVVQMSLRSKTSANSHVQLSFQPVECSEKSAGATTLKLAALISASPASDNGLVEATPLADAPGLAIGGGGASSLRSVQSASSLTNYSQEKTRALPADIRPGQVVGLSKVALSLGDQDSATIVTGLKQNLRLEPATRFILVAVPPVASTNVARETIPASPTAQAPVPEPKDEMEICEGACGIVTDRPLPTDAAASTPSATVTLKRVGYAPRLSREVGGFDYETTVTWLDPQHLLCTYDPHQLRSRITYAESTRTIEAVVINAETHAIERTLKWHVNGERRYLWALPGGEVLVHIGHELRVLDSDLKPVRAMQVDRPVAWVAAAPDGGHIVVALTDERHSPTVHEDLTTRLGKEPEEDLEVVVLDGNLTPILRTHRSSDEPTPVLSDSGELRPRSQGHDRWKIQQYGWDKHETDLVATRSSCRPSLFTPASGLVFATGCNASGGHWYRMLRADGHPLLKGESPSYELGQSAEASSREAFAVRVLAAAHPLSMGQPFHRSDLVREQITVYRTSDGHSLSSFSSTDFTLSQLSYALSPDSRQIATVGRDSITFFAIPDSRR